MAHLHTNYVKQEEQNKASEGDKTIRAYIDRYGDTIYDEKIADENDWQIFYQLSNLRTGILNWYDFGKKAEVLEIGAEFGALTGKLCEKCKHVTVTERSLYRANAIAKRYKNKNNLDIYAGNVKDMQFPQSFDYIILIGVLEYVGQGASDGQVYAEYLKMLQKWLKPDGKLLIAVENRFGLRYFCGTAEPHTNRAFDGINHYPQGTGGYSFSRKELEDIVEKAGYTEHKFYYPLPDYTFPQLIFTDEYLPEQNLKERLIPYYRRNDTLVASEAQLYDEIIKNKVFPFFANSFFIECSKKKEFSRIIYAAISTDRGSQLGFATKIYADGRVLKEPLEKEGIPNADKLYRNILDLNAQGIPVVKHELLSDGSLQLPYITHPTLSNALKEIIKRDIDTFLEIIDKLYSNILQSSKQAGKEQNELLRRQLPFAKTQEEEEQWKNADFGPILKRAYIELIPLNCFYDSQSKELLYFDQEFVRENYPAKYVLFRAIHYIYCFTPDAEKYYPKQLLMQKYEMEDTWGIYEQEEERFLNEVRNRKQYSWFYKRTAIDLQRLKSNAERLESEEEIVANYKISHKMKQIWKVELDILDEVERICKKYNLTYFLVHGSLLGAVRHKGFIPWDDDLDIAMLRSDYRRFLEVAPKELKAPLTLHTPLTEQNVFWGGYARIRNGQTTGIETKDLQHDANLGIWIDILPLDNCTENEKRFSVKQKKIRHAQRLLYAKIYGRDYQQFRDMKPGLWKWYTALAKCYSHKKLCKKLETAMLLYTEEPSANVAFFSAYYSHRRLDKQDFTDTVLLEFEHRKVPVPKGYEHYLFMTIGKDYMKYPPKEERKPKHEGIYDPFKPYSHYTKMLGEMFQNIQGKQIILFGAGMMFEDYMKKWGKRYRPNFLVDNDANKWGRFRQGILIKAPETILEVPKEKRHLIICSFYYKEIQEQLGKMGIHDYHVYIQHAEWIVKTERQEE